MPATDCIFCKIANKELASDIVYEDEQAVAFRDINPQAPVHVLVIPRKHVAGIKSATADDEAIVGHCVLLARSIAQQEGLAERGYRIVINSGADAGESVPHLHVHVLGGRQLGWPPG